jgi:hypothetical protein
VHVRRDANEVAHVLVKCAISQMLDKVCIGEYSPFILKIALAELYDVYVALSIHIFLTKYLTD